MAEQVSNSEQATRERREIIVARAGERLLGVFAEEAAGIERGSRPTPLPHAPLAVLGIVSVRGRILTLLDSSALLGESRAEGVTANAQPPFILALRGEEQLALAVDSAGQLREICTDEIEQPTGAAAAVAHGTFQDENTQIIILDVARLFSVAVEGMTERRRNRLLHDEK
ncbi:MAG TPA: chemotaxis protein CheW [Pyrinomonadaceae bacterium]|jgi:purine-binding chemotaxis protein CheW